MAPCQRSTRLYNVIMRKTLFFLAVATRSFTCLEFMAKGFSHNTFFPALSNSRPTLQCSVCSTPTYTMSARTQMFQAQLQTATQQAIISARAAWQLFTHQCPGRWPAPRSCLRNTMPVGKLFGTFQAPRCNDCYLCEREKNTHINHSVALSAGEQCDSEGCGLFWIEYLVISRWQSLHGHAEVWSSPHHRVPIRSPCWIGW